MAELDAVVGQHCVDAIRHRLDHGVQERHAALPVGRLRQPRDGEPRGPVNGDEQVELALAGADLGDVEVEEPDRIGFERPLARLVALDLRQAADAVAVQAAVQAGSRQVRQGRLQSVQAVVERRQRMPAERHHRGLLLQRQCR